MRGVFSDDMLSARRSVGDDWSRALNALRGGAVAKATRFGRLENRAMLVAYTGVRRHQNLYTKCCELLGVIALTRGSVTMIGRRNERIKK